MPSVDATTWRSPNHSSRNGADIWACIVHSCEGKPAGDEQQSSLPWLVNPTSGVSCHYYVTREGKIYQLVDDSRQAWHAGESVLNGVWYCNGYSIGIELEHRDNAAMYPTSQIDSLTWLCRNLIAAYAIPRSGMATHRQVAQPPGRKSDPTDIDDLTFAAWADSLYLTDPLRARTIAGPPGQAAVYCSIPAHEYYTARGGLNVLGYPLHDQYASTFGNDARPCSILPCERATIKESPNFGVELALIAEALVEGWIP